MAYIFPFTTLVDRPLLGVGMSAFFIQMPSAARLTEVRPNAKTKIVNILVVFIFFSFQNSFNNGACLEKNGNLTFGSILKEEIAGPYVRYQPSGWICLSSHAFSMSGPYPALQTLFRSLSERLNFGTTNTPFYTISYSKR
jgi:hypothetical protein